MAMLLACLMVIGVTFTANAAETTLKATTYAVATDVVTPVKGTTKYKYYTTANASKKVPAANMWVRTDAGAIDLSGVPGASTLYLANSTTPKHEEIVCVKIPAAPVLSAATYNPAATTLDDMFVFKTKVQVKTVTTPYNGSDLNTAKAKTKTAAEALVVPHTYIQIKLSELDEWGLFSAKMTTAQVEKFQRHGGTIYARIIASAKTKIVLSDDEKTATLADNTDSVRVTAPAGSDNGKTKVEKTIVDDSARTIVRAGVAKTIKIARKAYGPAMSIDYANHAFTLKNTQAYGTATADATEPTSWTNFTSENPKIKTQRIYFGSNGNVSANMFYGLKTVATAKAPDSLTSFITIPKDVALADTTSATISGGYGTNAVMKIRKTAEADAVAAATDAAALKTAQAAAKNIAYQYAIVNLSPDNEDFKNLVAANSFNYSNTKVKWFTVKTGVDGTLTVNLPWKTVGGNQVLVRKAAVGTEFSSQVEIFNAPTKEKGGTNKGLNEVGCWSKLTLANYGAKGFTATNNSIEYCPYVEVTYKANKKFDIYVYAAGKNTAIDQTKIKVAIGNKTYNATNTVGPTVVTKTGSGNSVVNYDFKIEGLEFGGLTNSNANKIAFTFEDGFVKSTLGTNLTTPKLTASVTADTLAPNVKSARVVMTTPVTKTAAGSGTLTVVFDTKLKLNGTVIDEAGAALGTPATYVNQISKKINNNTTWKVTYVAADSTYTYNKKTKQTTFIIPFTVAMKNGNDNPDDEKTTVSFVVGKITDESDNNLVTTEWVVDSPFYNANYNAE